MIDLKHKLDGALLIIKIRGDVAERANVMNGNGNEFLFSAFSNDKFKCALQASDIWVRSGIKRVI